MKAKDYKHTFTCFLALWDSSADNFIFRSIPHSLIGLFGLLATRLLNSLYILEISMLGIFWINDWCGEGPQVSHSVCQNTESPVTSLVSFTYLFSFLCIFEFSLLWFRYHGSHMARLIIRLGKESYMTWGLLRKRQLSHMCGLCSFPPLGALQHKNGPQ